MAACLFQYLDPFVLGVRHIHLASGRHSVLDRFSPLGQFMDCHFPLAEASLLALLWQMLALQDDN